MKYLKGIYVSKRAWKMLTFPELSFYRHGQPLNNVVSFKGSWENIHIHENQNLMIKNITLKHF